MDKTSLPTLLRSRMASFCIRQLAIRLVALVFLVILAIPAHAQEAGEPQDIIAAGREAEVLALFEPVGLGGELQGGWVIENLAIDRGTIHCGLLSAEGQLVEISLVPSRGLPDNILSSTSFGFVPGTDAQAPPDELLTALHDLVNANDRTWFYTRPASAGNRLTGSNPPLELNLPFGYAAEVLIRLVLDGFFASILAFFLLITLLIVHFRRDGLNTSLAVLGAFVVGLVLRLLFSENVAMGAWPFSRLHALTAAIHRGPLLVLWGQASHSDWSRHEFVTSITWYFSLVTPLAIYTHARYLLRDKRAAVAAAWLIAVLPQHIRFSHSEVAFIPSIVVAALLFATSHMALREERRSLRIFAYVALPIISIFAYSLRPLNLIFYPLILWMIFGLDHSTVPRFRKWMASGLTALGVVYTLIYSLFAHYQQNLEHALGTSEIFVGIRTLIHFPHLFIPLNFHVTPPLILLLAGAGIIVSLRGERRRLGIFLIVWFWLFVLAHAYVVAPAVPMQARYYLHMVVPMVFAAGFGLAELQRRTRWYVMLPVGALLLLSPLLHQAFIHDLDYGDTQEYAFVTQVTELIPDDCTVYEYVGQEEDEFWPAGGFLRDSRMEFAAERNVNGAWQRTFTTRRLDDPTNPGVTVSPEAAQAFANPEACTMVFLGLSCWGHKDPALPVSPVCEQFPHQFPNELVASHEAPHRLLDPSAGPQMGEAPSPMEFRLYRLIERPGPAGAAD